MTLREAHLFAANRLAQQPELREQASRDAASLLLHVLRLPPIALHAHPERPLTGNEAATLNALLDRRLNFEPIQYILGEQEFYGLPFRVTPATLIPRPETELLVEAVLNHMPRGVDLHLIDVGTGSGAIAVALAKHLPQARVLALDLSPEALLIAQENAQTSGVSTRIDFRQSDLLSDVLQGSLPPTDAIVSNPPYIPEPDRLTLHPQVRDHEPATALFAGPDGLAIYRRLIPQAWNTLKPGGLLALEFGYGQSAPLRHLLEDWANVELLNDLQVIPRVALARKP